MMIMMIMMMMMMMMIFSDMTEGLLHLLDQNIEMFEDEIKELEEDLGLLETKADLTLGRDNVDVEE